MTASAIHRRDNAWISALKGKKAIVCAASKGLGRACAMSLAREGVDVVITARTAADLERTAEEIRKETGVKVTAVAGDITTDAGRAAALAACPQPDILVNNAGGPPRGDFREWGRDDWIKAVDANMLTPIFLIKAVVDGMIERKFGRIVNITSASVKSPIPELGMSNGARAGLTGFVAGLARQIARHNVIINNILPGPFLTDRLRSGFQEAARAATGRWMNWCRSGRRTRRPAASAIRPSSAMPAPSCVRRRSASSSGRTCCSTAARSIRPARDGSDLSAGLAPRGTDPRRRHRRAWNCSTTSSPGSSGSTAGPTPSWCATSIARASGPRARPAAQGWPRRRRCSACR